MAKKYIILDTETTGLEVQQGHRVIEIGAVLINDRNKSKFSNILKGYEIREFGRNFFFINNNNV